MAAATVAVIGLIAALTHHRNALQARQHRATRSRAPVRRSALARELHAVRSRQAAREHARQHPGASRDGGRSQKYLDALGETAGDNVELQREVAVGLARLAEVQGVPGRAHVGDPAGAKSNLERAERILVKLTADHAGAGRRGMRDLGRVRYLLALVYGGAEQRLRAAAAKAQEAEKNLQDCARGTPTADERGPRRSTIDRRARHVWTGTSAADLGDLNMLLTSAALRRQTSTARASSTIAAADPASRRARLLALPTAVRRSDGFRVSRAARPRRCSATLSTIWAAMTTRSPAYRRAGAALRARAARTPRHRTSARSAAVRILVDLGHAQRFRGARGLVPAEQAW